ncbi:MAG: PilN domain-containing protein [Deltaproteobacteria bacterium]|jgi:Tfp pilus assembly protein PilN|nr:PilN domain-containing protein [Deltaproteobacteria bacterium]
MMIKINLLPLESFKQTATGQLSVTIFAFVMLALGIVLYLFKAFIMDAELTKLGEQKDELTKQLNQLKQSSTLALKQTTDFVDQFKQVSVISELEERRRDQTRLFNSIAGEVINQASWLTSLNHTNKLLTLRGMAIDLQVVADFHLRLEQNPYLSNVKLVRSEETSINNVALFTFDFIAETHFESPTLLKDGLEGINLPPREKLVQLVAAAAPNLAKTLQDQAAGPATL